LAESVLGLDFGTTNSLAAYIDPLGGVRSLTNVEDRRPHPSTVWYRAGSVIVGREARQHLESASEAIAGAFVTSPKRLLRKDAPVEIDGSAMDPRDIAAEVLKFLRDDASSPNHGAAARTLDRAVMTIPVDLDGEGRRRLRDAARKAGIAVEQFVHEPLAALYGWLRSQADYASKLAHLEGRRVLVFDWGGGTLDLTLCLIRGRKMIQLANRGDNDVGGDFFDEVIRNEVRKRHATEHGIENIVQFETPESRTRLLAQCELAKIELSSSEDFPIFLPNYLNREDGRHLNVNVTRADLEEWTQDLVNRGLSQIDVLLEEHQLSHREIELCLPTGGMVNAPAVRNGLLQRFVGRVPQLDNGDRVIAEGAAWIAHDGLRLRLAKPIELLQPDGTYLEIVGEDHTLPVENQNQAVSAQQFYCVDPRDGVASFVFARPKKVGYGARSAPRENYVVLPLRVDKNASPFIERLNISLTIDHDYIVHIEGHSSGMNDRAARQIHDLEFALALPAGSTLKGKSKSANAYDGDPSADGTTHQFGAVQIRSNITARANDWQRVPGDIIETWRDFWFEKRSSHATARQKAERDFYRPCAICKRIPTQFDMEGCVACSILPKGTFTQKAVLPKG
jgi:hypothetical protein